MRQKFARVLAAFLVVCMLALPVLAGADLGGFSGGSDYGGGGSSDWGGSSSDWDSNWSSSSGSTYYYDGDSDEPISGGSMIFALVIFIVIVVLVSRGAKKSGAKAGQPAGAQRTAQSQLKPMGDYQVIDPNFSADDLVERISNLYVQMQNACTARDLSSLRPYFTDALYGQFDRQIQQLKAAGRVNHVDNIAVLGVTLRGWQQDDQNDRIIAEVRTRITDYTVDEKTGAVVSGSRDKEKFMTYEYALVRTKGRQTQDQETLTSLHCPSCGAPLDVAHSAQCPYCGNIITLDDHDWVVAAIRGISQQTV